MAHVLERFATGLQPADLEPARLASMSMDLLQKVPAYLSDVAA